MTAKIILIHPPIVKPSEPPAGIGRLSACLHANGVPHEVVDANWEGIQDLLFQTARHEQTGPWNIRACRNLNANLDALRNIETYENQSRYSRSVLDINRVLALAGIPCGARLSLADYSEAKRSPVKSRDLLWAAENPESNPFYPYFRERLAAALADPPDFIGFSLNYLSQALCTMAMIGFIKKVRPAQKIILGGTLATSWVKNSGRAKLFDGWVDEMVAGAGEEKLLQLMGVSDARQGPTTDYTLLRQNRYLSPGFILPYSAARGCWWRRCAFCPEKAEDNPYIPEPASRAARELRTLSCLMKPSLIHLLDSSLAPSLMEQLTATPPGAPWYGFARVTPHLADEDFCRALKASGCRMLKLGIESGDPSVLDSLNKGIDLPTVSAALRALKKAGIATYGYFLFGAPPENESSALKTMDFICRHIDCIDFLNLAIFNLPAASIEADTLATQDFYEGDLSLYKSFRHPAGWERQNVRLFLEKKLKKHPAISPVVMRTPAYFTSNHAPFFDFSK